MKNKALKILFVVNVDWFFISHRLCIAQTAIEKGWDVTVAAEDTGRSEEIIQCGVKFINFSFSRSGTNPLKELFTLNEFRKLYKKITPDIVHHITLKPVIYGSLAAKFVKIPAVVNAVSGLGYNFTGDNQGFVAKIMLQLMKIGFKHKNLGFIFQNNDDYSELKSLGVLNEKNKIFFIKGSGVNLKKFNHSPMPTGDRIFILFPVRMLWDKGVAELREATNLLKNKYRNKIQFILAGLADNDNKAGVSSTYLKDWEDGEYVQWIGYQKDMVAVYRSCHIVVLPSYREGMPRTLIEACAIGRPIVTTNAIGCRECVNEGVNGFKVPVKSTIELANAIEELILNPDVMLKMGFASRVKAEKEFDQLSVVRKHFEIYQELYEQ
ncbi:glycosyltransferase family 4 protein [Dokdonia sp. Hel_I_53]|uniref:glycosyltransferase family 4 protein n=1 Tax=Dokdonia sp. Hel_I_53 TaxID=1566287 RepID=UPI00119A7EF2|nr:glycosyltransferase family 4 protein [Dokdonia sp. Hel_I_53]TVZ51350.1 glycosyltransferase involved in cell wall biosynthesis [Dokdonia sp. Hel_I_53]